MDGVARPVGWHPSCLNRPSMATPAAHADSLIHLGAMALGAVVLFAEAGLAQTPLPQVVSVQSAATTTAAAPSPVAGQPADSIAGLALAMGQSSPLARQTPAATSGGADQFKGSDSFAGEGNGLFVMQFTGGAFGTYEGNNLATGKTDSWHSEYYRVECEAGAAVLDADHIVRIQERTASGMLQVREVPTEDQWQQGDQQADQSGFPAADAISQRCEHGPEQ